MKVLIVITHGKIGRTINSVFSLANGTKEKNVEIKVGFKEGWLLEKLIEKFNLKDKIFLIGEIKDASKYYKSI